MHRAVHGTSGGSGVVRLRLSKGRRNFEARRDPNCGMLEPGMIIQLRLITPGSIVLDDYPG